MKLSGGSISGMAKQRWAAGKMHNFWFDVTSPVSEQKILSPSSSTQVQQQDRVYRRDSGSSAATDFRWTYFVDYDRPGPMETISRISSDNSVISPDATDVYKWNYQSEGSGILTLSSDTRTVSAMINTAVLPGAAIDTFLSYATGSMRKAADDSIDIRISGANPSTSLPIFLSGTYRNQNCWARDIDMTPIPYGGHILVSPRHLLCAAHAVPQTGTTITFIGTDNAIATRSVLSVAIHPNYSAYYPDLAVALLSSDVPSGISFAKTLPSNWTGYMPSPPEGTAVLVVDAEKKALVGEISRITHSDYFYPYASMVDLRVPLLTGRLAMYEEKIGGDSSSPVCLVVESSLVAISLLTFGGAGYGTSIVSHKNEINAMMSGLGGGYQLTDIDTSFFHSY